MQDHATLIRQCLITAMKDDAPVHALLSGRVFDQVTANPGWPFGRFDPPSKVPYESSCGNGWDMEWRLHLFARGPGTKAINDLDTKVFSALFETELSIPELSRFDIDFVRSNTGPDGDEVNDYHAVVVFRTVTVD
jgi:hypothetical protein